jgi:sulfatase maturation enzyme AslB (radical SAM superfamily)
MTRKQYRDAWDKAAKITPAVPLDVTIELSSVCNLLCPFCFISDPQHKQERRFMDLDLAIRIINEAHRIGVPALKFNWRGESTLNPNFSRIVEYAAQFPFHDLLINTNGNYSEHAIDGMMACTKVMFSLDSTVEATYNNIRVGGDMLKVLNNISKLIKAGHKNIWVRRVISDLNEREDFSGNVKRIFGNSVKVAEHYCFDRVKKQDKPAKRVYCGYPSQRLIVAVDGGIYPCCVDYDCTMPVGTAPALETAWNSDGLDTLRMVLKNQSVKTFPATCKGCTSWMGYDSPKRDFVQDREIK